MTGMMDHDSAFLSGVYRTTEDWIEGVARVGFVTKGVVYGIVGLLALQAAIRAGGAAEGARGAILEIGNQPFGQVLIVLTAVGLFGYALWRFVEALLDPEQVGSDATGIVKRIGYVASGILYFGLALWSAWIVLGTSSGGNAGGGTSQQMWTAKLMAQPSGQWLVGIVGALVVVVGLYHFYEAYRAGFMQKYRPGEMSPVERRWARRIGRFGISARGVTFCIIGGFLVQAAVQADPSESTGLAGALQTLSAQPYGPWLLGTVALGFVAYGIYCFSRARFSHFSPR